MNNLIENILNEDYVSANELFESRLSEIMESKLLEKKKMMQAEVFGGLSKQDIEDRKKAGYQKASDVLGDPSKGRRTLKFLKKPEAPKKKVVKEAQLADKPITSLVNRQKDMGDRYSAALSKARELETRGARGQVKMVRKTYAPYRAGREIGKFAKGAGDFAKNIISGLQYEGTE